MLLPGAPCVNHWTYIRKIAVPSFPIALEVVGHTFKAGLIRREDVAVDGKGHQPDVQSFAIKIIRTEPLKHQLMNALRRPQMGQCSHKLRCIPVTLLCFSWAAKNYVIKRLNVVLPAPFEQLHVLDGRNSLAHEAQDSCVKAFNPGLNCLDAGSRESPEML